MANKRVFTYDGYPCDPIDISNKAWFYVEHGGITVASEYSGIVGTIPWRKILKAVEDQKKAKSRRVRVLAKDRDR